MCARKLAPHVLEPHESGRHELPHEGAGYKSVEDINREDEDKLAIKTGLGIKGARAIKQGAEHFLSSKSKVIEATRREALTSDKFHFIGHWRRSDWGP